MNRFIFNKKYFDKSFMIENNQGTKISQETKIADIASQTFMQEETCRSKLIKMTRPIKLDDYNLIKQIDSCLILDTEKLIGKLILRVNKDLTPNERFVTYMMLCCLDEGQEWVSIEDLINKVEDGIYNKKKIETILKSCEVTIDDVGTKNNMFIYENGKYSIDLTTLILYTDYDLL